jgi:thiamine biosynthesis protein ThiI
VPPLFYLGKIGELMLKGQNRRYFEHRLTENARFMLASRKVGATVRLISGRLYVEGPDDAAGAIEDVLDHLVGITGWGKARIAEKTIEGIQAAVYEEALIAKAEGARTFKIETRRADKGFPLTSYQVSAAAPDRITDEGLLTVDVHHPEAVINVEIRDRVLVYCNAHKSCRGLPVGTAPRALLLLSGGIDSPVAGYRMMCRGMKVDCLYFDAPPYTSQEAQQKVVDLAAVLGKYGLGARLTVIPFTDIELRLQERVPEAFLTLLLRVCMVKAANLVAKQERAKCLVTGESLGQVASQTLENMTVTESFAELPILRPLVGMDKEEITLTARRIGTYDISILPYEDCCVLFAPKHPVLKAEVGEVQQKMEMLEIDPLLAEAFEKRTVMSL